MEGRQRRMPFSLSLQDLSAYRTISAPSAFDTYVSLLEEANVQKEVGSFKEKQKLGLLARSPLQGIGLYSKGIIVVVLMILLIVLLYSGFLWGKAQLRQVEQMQFAIILDCGSTSTRVNVYGWVHTGKSLPVMYKPPTHVSAETSPPSLKASDKKLRKAYHRMETEPGFHQLVHNATGLKTAVQPLLDWAKQQIPEVAHSDTPLFLLGTAGLRRLPTSQSEWLLDKAWLTLKASPFKCRRSWVRIISGEEEAYYGWVALNYNLNRLGNPASQGTVGALDLGGSSLEVTFEPDIIPRAEYGVNLTVGSHVHYLYAHSHPGFGLNDAFDKSVAILLNQEGTASSENGIAEVKHPCLHKDYMQPYICSSCSIPPGMVRGLSPRGESAVSEIQLVGDPDWLKCQVLAKLVVNSSASAHFLRGHICDEPSCALGEYQPQPKGKFYALAGFFVMYKFFGLSPKASLDELLEKGRYFCELSWPNAKDSVVPQPSVDRYCFRTPYVVNLLREGLHMSDEQIIIGSGDITWTQGAALLETGALFQRRSIQRRSWIGFSKQIILDKQAVTVLIFVLLVFLILVISFGRRKLLQRWQTSAFLPVLGKSGRNTGPSIWFPLQMHTKEWLRLTNENKNKPPHSPTLPDNGIVDYKQRSELEDGAGLSSDILRLPPPKSHHTVGSRLQSRRTLSGADLSLQDADNSRR